MRVRIVTIAMVIIMTVACIFAGANAHAEVSDPQPVCTVQVSNVVCVLAGVTILNQPLSLPTVKVTVPGPTVTLPPPPRQTITNNVEVEVPGPTKTVTAPGDTETIEAAPETVTTTVTATTGPGALPTATVTAPGLGTSTTTVTASTGQDDTTSGTVDPSDDGLVPDNTPTVVVTGIGIGIIALLAGLILLGMYGGYYVGYRDSDAADANFFRALLNKE